ncbi:MAG TPA: hypothetical protein VND93_18050 [Myxococcales bacterium]|nr:hypothetical protein [Myxococcales bacterium]
MRAPAADLARRLLARRPGGEAEVPAALEVVLAAVEGAYPQWPLSPEHFVDALAERLPGGPAEPSLRRLHAVDLYLAAAASRGMPWALEALERETMPRVRAALFRLGASSSDADDTAQKLRAHALVPEGGQPPRLSRYAGMGPLSSWLSVVAARLWMKETRRRTPVGASPMPDEALDRLMGSPELEAYRREARPALKAAFQRAVEALGHRDRTLLRLSAVDGLNGEEIGALYAVNRSSVARWLQQCRAALAESMRRELHAAGLDSLVGDLVSQLDLSLNRVLGAGPEPSTDRDAR